MPNKVDIGVLEEKNGWLLHPRFFPSKVGGKPAWLDLQNIPSPSLQMCKKCKEPLIFLCQIYAPYEEPDEYLDNIDQCFHRTIFIFICRSGACCRTNSNDNFSVLRCQLPRKNDYYSFHPYDEKEEEFSIEMLPKLCELCGAKGPSHCSKCKKVFYCSRSHQILDWKKGHKEKCPELLVSSESMKSSNFVVTAVGKSILFKEWEIVVDEEDEEDVKNVDVNEEMEKLQKLMQEKKVGTLENVSVSELEEYTKEGHEDKVFQKFSNRVARHPDQVLRYDRGGTPLWITGKPDTPFEIPKCQYCEEDRHFEFQIMPQLLNFIEVGIDFNGIDWGVLAIYTCRASCNNGPAYKEEVLIKQDLAN